MSVLIFLIFISTIIHVNAPTSTDIGDIITVQLRNLALTHAGKTGDQRNSE